MKILFFINDLKSGGKERRLVELINWLSKDPSYTMELVLTRKDIHYRDVLDINIKIHYLERKKRKDPKLFYKFYKITSLFRPDIIHVWGNMVAIYAIPSKILLNIPLINNQITNSTPQKAPSFLSHRLTFPFSDIILSNTYAGLKAYNAPKKKSKVIYNGFDFNRIKTLSDKEAIRKKFNIQTKFVVGMIASFSEKKDYKTFILAANKILENRQDISFLCVGAGDSSKARKYVELKNKANILFLGKQSDVESIMNICDIGVLLTDGNHGEGISNVILEFCALKKPVIATGKGGTKEIIEDAVSGFLIPLHDVDQLVDNIQILLNNKAKRNKIGENAYQTVIRKFSIEKMVQQFKTVYEQVKI